LSLYLADALGFAENTAAAFYHAFVLLCYTTPLIGALLADSILGKFKTILYLSIVYAIGQIVLTVGSIGYDSKSLTVALSFIGLVMIAFGTGGIKPCVVSFGAEQFKLPEQENRLSTYFSVFYASINAGSLIATILTPYLRSMECNDSDTCFPVAFGVPAALFIVAIAFFLGGRIMNMYTMHMPSENVLVKFVKCIWHSFSEWRQNRKWHKNEGSMMDYGVPKYGKKFVEDVKAVLNVAYMFLPFPLFWALFDQQGSRWTFQARHMNGDISFTTVLPDQIQVANPVMILAFIPLFEYGVYPAFNKFGLLKTPLQKIVTGGFLAAVAFFISGGLDLVLESNYPTLPENDEFVLTAYKGLPNNCDDPTLTLDFVRNSDKSPQQFNVSIDGNPWISNPHIPKDGEFTIQEFNVTCGADEIVFPETKFTPIIVGKDEVPSMHILLIIDVENENKGIINIGKNRDPWDKSTDGLPIIKFIWDVEIKGNISFSIKNNKGEQVYMMNSNNATGDSEIINDSKMGNIRNHQFFVSIDNEKPIMIHEQELLMGANYQFIYINTSTTNTQYIHQITEENKYHVFWQLPQYAVMTCGEVMFSLTSLEFAFSQAPESMRAVLQALNTLTVAGGNAIDLIIISFGSIFPKQAYEFFLFACLTVVDMSILAWMATRYKYVNYTGKAA